MEEVEYLPAETYDQLVARWAARDALYAQMRLPMSPECEAATRLGRKREASLLPVFKDRARAFATATTWRLPRHADYGNIKDWLDG